jgi:hypothetical protein
MRYGYRSGDWSLEALTRRGYQAGDEIPVRIPLTSGAQNLLENLRLGKKTPGTFLDPVSPMLIKLDNAQKIREEIIGCSEHDRSIGSLDFDKTDFDGTWARSISPVVAQEIEPIICQRGYNEIFVANDAGQTFVWRRPSKRLGSFPSYGSIIHKIVRIEPPYVFIKSRDTETKSIAVKVSKNLIVLKEVMNSWRVQPNRLILLLRCEEKLDAAIFDQVSNRIPL